MAKNCSGIFKLDSICAKLKNSQVETTKTVSDDETNPISESNETEAACDLSTHANMDSDINSNGIKESTTATSIRDQIPSDLSTNEIDASSAKQEMLKFDLSSTRQSDLASSNGSSVSCASLVDDVTKMAAASSGQAGSASLDGLVSYNSATDTAPLNMTSDAQPVQNRRKNRRKNAAPKNLGQMREMETLQILEDESQQKQMETDMGLTEPYRVNNPDVDFMAVASGPQGDMDQGYLSQTDPAYFPNEPQNYHINQDMSNRPELDSGYLQNHYQDGMNEAMRDDIDEEYLREHQQDAMDVDMGGVLDLSSSKTKSSTADSSHFGDTSHKATADFDTDDYGALDLSVGVHSSAKFDNKSLSYENESINEEHYGSDYDDIPIPANLSKKSKTSRKQQPSKSSTTANPIGALSRGSFSKPISAPKTKTSPEPTGTDATHMRNYAENTVNELLSMYGLGEDIPHSLSEDVPLQNFVSGNILKWNVAGNKMAAQQLPVTKENDGSGKKKSLGSSTEDLRSISPASLTRSNEDDDSLGPSGSYQSTEIGAIYSTLKAESNNIYEDDDSLGPGGSYQITKIGAMYSPLKAESNYPDYGKYVCRYRDWEQCGQSECMQTQIREHFHCRECPSKIFLKKDEMIRHFKWHRKRDESLQHGFMRYSPLDDCSVRFIDCAHNKKQTHYHCIQSGCSKVYISTSDVQMHANYHRKDSAIMQLGFQRFRATEDCETPTCPFYGQRTTHFHCRRNGCNFTFKNKADIDKHKTFHQKDDILAKDGFKKFMKYDSCNYPGCRFSKISNHIHCVRPGCDYVLHSTSQLLSHKRKHERREIEFAYRKFKDTSASSSANQNPPGAMLNPALLALSKQLPVQPKQQQQPPFLPQTATNKIVEMTTPEDSSDLSLMEYLKFSQKRDINKQLMGEDMSDNRSSPSLSESRMSEQGHAAMSDQGHTAMSEQGHAMSHQGHMGVSTSGRSMEVGREEGDVSMEEEEDDELNESADVLSKTHPGAFGVENRVKMDTKLSRSINLPLQHKIKPDPSLEGGADGENSHRADSPLTGQSPAGFVPKTSPPVNGKRERDETWKKYLTRYTANDPCHSRCQFLYKDHYHCNNATCGILFRSKDGVRDHARHHENLDRITELSYMLYSADQPCVESCPHSMKVKHYHCLWTGCDEVIPETAPIFQRLDHFHIHEYSRANGGRKPMAGFFKMAEQNGGAGSGGGKRKRGRPPKYPKHDIPVVPKLEMDESAIKAEAQRCGESDPIVFGYKKYERSQPCQDNKCVYYMKKHFHCVRQRCHHATDNEDVLNLHDRDFHHYVNILEGFEFFDRNVNCRRPHCHNNKVNRHFHCVRPKCDYSFVRYSTMSQHDKKHKMAEMGYTVSPGVAIPSVSLQNEDAMNDTKPRTSQNVPVQNPGGILHNINKLPLVLPGQNAPPHIAPGFIPMSIAAAAAAQNMIGSTGTSINLAPPIPSVVGPMAAQPGKQQPKKSNAEIVSPIVIQPIDEPSSPIVRPPAQLSLTSPHKTIPLLPKPPQESVPTGSSTTLPLASLLQQKGSNFAPQMNWTAMLVKMHYSIDTNCGRPFCKLKKKDHYHCFDCNQAFCDPIRLKSHAVKHGLILDKSNNISGRFLPRMSATTAPQTVAAAIPTTIQPHNPPSANHPPGPIPAVTTTDQTSDESEIDNDDDDHANSLNLNPMEFTNMLKKSQNIEVDTQVTTTRELIAAQMNMLNKQAVQLNAPLIGVPQIAIPGVAQSSLPRVTQNTLPGVPQNVQQHALISDNTSNDDEERCLEIDENATSEDLVDDSLLDHVPNWEPPKHPGRKRTISNEATAIVDGAAQAKKPRGSSGGAATGKQSTGTKSRRQVVPTEIPDGFEKYCSNEDCSVDKCTYRLTITHYHCSRSDCIFGTADRNRLVQHIERHRRTDEILGNEFRQFRLSQDCTGPACEHSGRGTHYHCMKCSFICLELSKVQAHRKHHQKQEAISAQGFLKVMASETCSFQASDSCSYSGRQTHYHCLQDDGNCKFIAHGQQAIVGHNKSTHGV